MNVEWFFLYNKINLILDCFFYDNLDSYLSICWENSQFTFTMDYIIGSDMIESKKKSLIIY